MTSKIEQERSDHPTFKKKRMPGACDNCKKKKIRCDSAETPGNRCSNCVQLSLECTHKEVSKTLGPAKGYVESLEIRLEKMERLLRKLKPGIDLNQELDELDGDGVPPGIAEMPRNDDDVQDCGLTGRMKNLYVDPPHGLYFGKSSGYQLVQTALDIKMDYIGKESAGEQVFRGTKRPEFWLTPSWFPNHLISIPLRVFSFPPNELMSELVDGYFEHVNAFMPLLHRPSFVQSLAEGLHHRSRSFGTTLLLVCALGARYSDDPRVYYHSTDSGHAIGFKWLEQVNVQESFVSAASLEELQNYALYIEFMHSTSTPQIGWVNVGIALRRAQEVGAHRKRRLKIPTAEDELWKRAFWVLMCLDQLLGSFSGRQCMIQERDHDVDILVECDDEYWDQNDPALNFKQPEGKPSTVAFFNSYLKLMNILSYAMGVVYSIRKPERNLMRGIRNMDQQIIMELDSAMNSWMDSVPDHLRWDPNAGNKLFQKQSAILYATYYHLQICIHRPFIPSFRNPSPTTFPSLAICTNAARSCCHVLDSPSVRYELPLTSVHMAMFTAGVVLLLNIWNGKRNGRAPNPQREMEDVQKCMNLLKACEDRWSSAGRYLDVLVGLASAGNFSIFQESANTRSKRPRETNEYPDLHTRQSSVDKAASPTVCVSEEPSLRNEPASVPGLVRHPFPIYGEELEKQSIYEEISFPQPQETFSSSRRGLCQPLDYPSLGCSNPEQTSPQYRWVNCLPVPLAPDIVRSATFPSPMGSPGSLPRMQQGQEQQQPQQHPSPFASWDIRRHPEACIIADGRSVAPLNGRDNQGIGVTTDPDIMTMWANAPSGFELNEWGTYMTSVNQIMHGSSGLAPS